MYIIPLIIMSITKVTPRQYLRLVVQEKRDEYARSVSRIRADGSSYRYQDVLDWSVDFVREADAVLALIDALVEDPA